MNRPTLLCVDDDPGIRQLYEAMLGTYGYEVLVAEGGHQALNLFRSKTKEIDAVISDYEMPGMNGAQLAAELKRYDPEIPVIVISGFLPILEQTPYFVDATVPKGASVEKIVDHIEICLRRVAPDKFPLDCHGRCHLIESEVEGHACKASARADSSAPVTIIRL